MEHRTETSLRERIADWKTSFQSKKELTQDNLDEIESHLLDEIDELTQVGLTKAEAFLVAKDRIGDRDEVAKEFRKVNKWNYLTLTIKPYLIGALGFIALKDLHEIFVTLLSAVSNELGFIDFWFISIAVTVFFVASVVLILRSQFNSKKSTINMKWLIVLAMFPILNFIVRIIAAKYFLDVHTFGILHRNIAFISIALYGIFVLSILFYLIVKVVKGKHKFLVKN